MTPRCAENAQAIELLHRRIDLEDAVSAHLAAAARAPCIGFGTFVISATAPFQASDAHTLRTDAASVVRRYVEFDDAFATLGWSMYASIDRVYVNDRARNALGWSPRHDFASILARVKAGEAPLSDLAKQVGVKGYHERTFDVGPYPVDA